MSRETPEQKRERRYRLRADLVKRLGGKCLDCGATADLEFAHQVPTKLEGRGRGSWARLYDVKRHPLKYALLCRRCHEVADGLHANYPWVCRTPAPAAAGAMEKREEVATA